MLSELTNKIKKIIPEKDASYMGEEFEFNFTLEDILRCIQINTPFRVDPFAFDVTITTKNGVFRWFLLKPLHEQSEETIKELNKLI